MKQFMKRSIALKAIGLSVALLIVLAVVWQRSRVTRAAGNSITLTTLAGGFNTPIGVDVYEPTGELIASANYPSGSPNNLNLVHMDGTKTPYSSLTGLTNELKIATVRSSACQGGFQVGDLFTGNGNPGQIVKVDSGGATVTNPWVTLTGEPALIRGSLYQDRACAFGGDLIVVTGNEQTDFPGAGNVGNVWRVTSAGVATKIAQFGTHLEGAVTVPNDPARFGPLAGRILAGAEDLDVSIPGKLSYGPNGRIYAIGPSNTLNGDVITIGADDGFFLNYPTSSPIHPEDIDLMRKNATFFGVAFADGKILTAASTDFDAFCDDILITQELPSGHFPNDPPAPGVSGLSVLKFNSGTNSFDITPLTLSDQNQVIAQWEHVTFLTGNDCITVLPCPAGSFSFNFSANGDLNIIYDQFPAPNDNSYGVNAVGWGSKGHTFGNLVGSDHAGFQLTDQNGVVKSSFNIDYITQQGQAPFTPSHYKSLGPFGGDGKIVVASSPALTPNDILFDTSLARNLNNLGYCSAGNCTVAGTNGTNLFVDSPPTVDTISDYTLKTPNPWVNGWDFHDTYFVTLKAAYLASIGFNAATWKVEPNLAQLHNSPAKPCPTTIGGQCNLAVTKTEVKDRQVKITIKNNGTADAFLTAVNLTWPNANGKLKKIKLDGDVIYDNPDIACCSANLTLAQLVADKKKRSIKHGSSDVLTFEFEKNASASGYTGTVEFGTGCTLTIGP